MLANDIPCWLVLPQSDGCITSSDKHDESRLTTSALAHYFCRWHAVVHSRANVSHDADNTRYSRHYYHSSQRRSQLLVCASVDLVGHSRVQKITPDTNINCPCVVAATQLPMESQDIIIASGCSGALDIAIGALAGEGSNILVPAPGFSLYVTLASSRGIKTRSYNCLVGHTRPLAH